jgi:hypothetical protein
MNSEPKMVRHDHELPKSVEQWGWKYHHLGIPTDKKFPNEQYIPKYKLYVSGFDSSPFGIEWMRFEEDSPFDELIKTVPHLAFVVADLEFEITTRNLKLLGELNQPYEGFKVAMIEHNGAPVELMEFT